MPIFFPRADRPRHRVAKKIFLTPWYLLVSSQPMPEQWRRSFCLISLPTGHWIKNFPTAGPGPKQLAHPHHRDGYLSGSHKESEWAQLVLFQHLVCNSQFVELVFWELWASIMQISTLGVLKNVPKVKSYIFVFAYLHLHAMTHGCQGLSTTSHAHLDIWTFSSAKKMLFPILRYTLCNIWNKYLQLPFWFFPSSPFPSNIMFS